MSQKFVQYDKDEQFDKWYNDVLIEGEMIKYHDISGCYVILPNSFYIWEKVKEYLDKRFKEHGVENCYFPMLINSDNLEKEKEHLKGFAPEVAWITGYGQLVRNELGRQEPEKYLEKNLAIRPTSETIMYPYLKELIGSHFDLPMKLNQWCNVVRWEFKNPTPFIRSREFLWNEGHSAFETKDEADKEIEEISQVYHDAYKNVLSVPTIIGYKSEKEKFSGGDYTVTLETFIKQTGKAVQSCTVHSLGQNFSKIFDLDFHNKEGTKDLVWQNSWGFTTRSIGAAIMIHGDNKGMIIPPQVSKHQVVIVPIYNKKNKNDVFEYVSKVIEELKKQGIRYHFDMRNNKPGWKFNYWEKRGVPLRFEIGMKDVEKQSVCVFRRDVYDKFHINLDELGIKISKLLNEVIPENLYGMAEVKLNQSIVIPDKENRSFDKLSKIIAEKKLFMVPFSGDPKDEEVIKNQTRAKSLCFPRDQDKFKIDKENCNCIVSGKPSKYCLFGRSY